MEFKKGSNADDIYLKRNGMIYYSEPMGIPSYYKKLLETCPDLLQSQPSASVAWLFMDYNCLIYHCLGSPTLRPFPVDATLKEQQEWESELIAEIVAYTLHIIMTVAPENGVYLAIDGVVPMAKMRQQRLRRFKSAWLAKHGWSEKPTLWDTNAITPGTMFMKRLREGLEKMIRSKRKTATWRLSSSDEPGEGEHKILREWRQRDIQGTVAVYGMDADLILLTMLCAEQTASTAPKNILLFREAQSSTADAVTEWEWFSIAVLRTLLCTLHGNLSSADAERQWILTYCCAMSLLGNDFVPRSLSFTLRDEGNAELVSILRTLPPGPLFTEEGLLCAEQWAALFQHLADREPTALHTAIQKKRRQAQYVQEETEMGQRNWPLTQLASDEQHLLTPYYPYDLRDDWQAVYIQSFFHGWHSSDHRCIVEHYLDSLQWVWTYYWVGADAVCYNWYYPHSLPPTWTTIAAYGSNRLMKRWSRSLPIEVKSTDVQPTEQLALVLPHRSWSLIPSTDSTTRLRAFPERAPYFFPSEFTLDSVGKRFFWECEPCIPVPSITELKAIVG